MDGQAMLDTVEGAHIEIENLLQRMRELSVQARNDTNDSNDRTNLQQEMNALTTEIDRISSVTSWAGQNLLTGSEVIMEMARSISKLAAKLIVLILLLRPFHQCQLQLWG